LRIFHSLLFLIPGVLLIVDLALTGSGQWSEPLGFSVRRLSLLMIMGYSFVAWILSARIPHALGAVLALALFILIWGVDLPLLHQVPFPDAMNDSQLFLGLLFAPALTQMIMRIGCWPGTLRLIERLIWVLAFLHIAIFLYYKIFPDNALELIATVRSILEPNRSAFGETNFIIGPGLDGFRVFWGSSIFLLLGIYFSVVNFGRYRRLVSLVILLTIAFAIELTLTRAMQLSIPLFLVLAWAFDRLLIRLRLGTALYVLLGIALLAVTLPIVLLANPTLLSAIDLARQISDHLRYEQISALTNGIMANPWFGGGLGAHVDLIRSEASPWIYELGMLALYMKIGFIGALCLVAVFMLFGRSERVDIHGHRRLPSTTRRTLSRLAALLCCIIFCSNTNPYLFSMLGWGLLMFTYVEFCVVMRKWQVTVAQTQPAG